MCAIYHLGQTVSQRLQKAQSSALGYTCPSVPDSKANYVHGGKETAAVVGNHTMHGFVNAAAICYLI